MKFRNLMLISLIVVSANAQAAKIQKFEVKSDQSIFDGYAQDGEIYLYTPVGQQKVQPSEVFASLTAIDGLRGADTVLLHTKFSAQVACRIEAVFENNDVYVFCDEVETVKSAKGNGEATYKSVLRTHYLQKENQVEKDVNSFLAFTKDQVIELKLSTERFNAGEKIRITHVFVSGHAVIEHFYRKIAPSIIPEYQELVSFEQLK